MNVAINVKTRDLFNNDSSVSSTNATAMGIGSMSMTNVPTGYNLQIDSDFQSESLDGWEDLAGSATCVTATSPESGAYAMQNVSGQQAQYSSSYFIPASVNRVYLLEGYLKTVSGSGGIAYLGIGCFDQNYNMLGGNWQYIAASGVTPPASFTYYSGVIGAGQSITLPAGTVYIKAFVILNYSPGGSIHQAQGIRIREVIESAYIDNLAVTTAKIGLLAVTQAQVFGLVVGDAGISMGSNAYISWSNVTSPPAIPNGTYINGSGVYTGIVSANNVSAGTIVGSTIETAASGGEQIVISAGDNKTHYYGNNGSAIEELATIGIDSSRYTASCAVFGSYTPTNDVIGAVILSYQNTALFAESYYGFGIQAFSYSSTAVYGTSTTGSGVEGASTNNYGVYGASTNSYGVCGASTNSYGVYGASTNSIGGVFVGATSTSFTAGQCSIALGGTGSGSASVGASAAVYPSHGFYNWVVSSVNIWFEINIGGTWYNAPTNGLSGCGYFDGTNQRFYGGGGSGTVYWQRY